MLSLYRTHLARIGDRTWPRRDEFAGGGSSNWTCVSTETRWGGDRGEGRGFREMSGASSPASLSGGCIGRGGGGGSGLYVIACDRSSGSGSEGGESGLNWGGGIQRAGGDVPKLSPSEAEVEYTAWFVSSYWFRERALRLFLTGIKHDVGW